MIKIYTDGASKGNPGNGGYGVVLLYKNLRKELSEGFRLTTNNIPLHMKYKPTFQWVKGHAGNPLNERCDELAVTAATGYNLPADVGYEAEQNAK